MVKATGTRCKELMFVNVIVECQKKHKQTYGICRIPRQIQLQTEKRVNLQAILRLMRKLNLLSVVRRHQLYAH